MASDVHIAGQMIAILLLFSVSVSNCSQLFDENGPVVLLNVTTFRGTVLLSDTAWFAEFYSSWCGHCIRFAPTWTQLAASVKAWSSVVQVASVNCAEEINMPLCRDYDISYYPTLKLFPPYATKNDSGVVPTRERGMENLIHQILDYVEAQSLSARPPGWPKIHVLESLDDIWYDVMSDTKYVVVIFEDEGSYLGREVILELSAYRQRLLIRRMLKGAVAKYGLRKLPALIQLEQDGRILPITTANTTTSGFVAALQKLIGVDSLHVGHVDLPADGGDEDNGDTGAGLNPVSSTKNSGGGVGVHMQDLESGIQYAVRREIASHKTLSGDQLSAVKGFIHILSKYFRGSDVVVRFLLRLDAWLQSDKSASISGELWLNMTYNLQTVDGYLPTTVRWVGCKGSKPNLRGYPCSLWTLFHRLTVSAAEIQPEGGDPLEVLTAMRSYIVNMFGCHECGQNFLKMAKTLEKEIMSMDDAILWLWDAHNKANARLHGDPSEDLQHLKIQFPPVELCPSCIRKAHVVGWDEAAILEFLKKFYGTNNTILDAEPFEYSPGKNDRRELAKDTDITELPVGVENDVHGKRTNDNKIVKRDLESLDISRPYHVRLFGLNSLDFSICLLFYCACTGLLIFGYFHFLVRKRVKICNIFTSRKSSVIGV